MPCMTGSGAALQAEFTLYGPGQTSGHNAVLEAVIAGLDIETMGNWQASIADLRAPRLKDAFSQATYQYPRVRYCLGDTIEHEQWSVTHYHDPAIAYPELLGKQGTFMRTHQDGSTWTGQAAIVVADGCPSEEANELSIGELMIRWLATDSGANVGGPFHTPGSGTIPGEQ